MKETMSDTCEWRDTFIFPGYYSVSEDGNVRSERNGKILKPATDKHGYHYYVLCVEGERRTVKAHRLVAKAFVPNPHNKPTVNHKNGIRNDNRASNLEWLTNKEQSNDPLTRQHMLQDSATRDYQKMGAIRNFGRIPVGVWRTDNNSFVGEFPSQKAASDFTGVSPCRVSQCVSGKIKSCRGYEFKEIEEFPIAVTKKRFSEEQNHED